MQPVELACPSRSLLRKEDLPLSDEYPSDDTVSKWDDASLLACVGFASAMRLELTDSAT